MTTPATVPALVARPAEEAGDAPSLLAPGRPALGYAQLGRFVTKTASALREAGVAPDDRVGLVVPNGPEAASAFLTVSAVAACAPLNPAYRQAELDFYLRDLGARFVIVAASLDSPVRDVAGALGARVLELQVDERAPAGEFALEGISPTSSATDLLPADGDVALVLHTSGTTARPKIVPLTHRNLWLSASSISSTLRLSPGDRCLNVMPLFHIHGLVAALLASLQAGASVVCAPGFHPHRFFDVLRECEPTWYTAVPTMHQAILERLVREPEIVQGHRLRFARSSSASLPVPVLEGLERALGIPVIEAYGMTEAAHQMTSNPLPPGVRRPGTVGVPAGPEVAVLGADGTQLPVGDVGEVAIRGESVFGGYDGPPEVNAAAFVGEWFRTGDEGAIDEDGYLALRGRIKEIINRGGEKVGPLEVDDVLSAHPAVAQAVTFAVPDPRLGDEVVAAVVLRPDVQVDERELQDFAVHRLAPFKVPRRVLFVDEIPKGPTGKIQRIGLAERLGVGPFVPGDAEGDLRPRDALENELEKVWADVLGLPRVGVRDDFFALGGDSILGAEAVARMRDLLDMPDLPLIAIVRAPTVEAMVDEIERGRSGRAGMIVPLHTGGSRPPLFFVHGLDGDVVGYAALARRLDDAQPFFALRAPGLDGVGTTPDRVEELAAAYLREIRAVLPHGPYLLGGFCMGAGVAVELAHRLRADGEEVPLLVLIDPRVASAHGTGSVVRRALAAVRARSIRSVLRAGLRRNPGGSPADAPAPAGITQQMEPLARARDSYRANPLDVPAVVFLSPGLRGGELSDHDRAVLRNVVRCTQVAGSHGRRFHVGSVEALAHEMNAALEDLAPYGQPS
jgi:acyl-CoA synthetase (AMP-forming)/AMP-acid ligase II/thioesterase domain-containing protein